MIRSALRRLLLLASLAAVLALLPAPVRAHTTRALHDRAPSSLPQLLATLPAEAQPNPNPFASAAPARRPVPLVAPLPLLRCGCFGGERGFWIIKYTNANPTRYVDPTGHDAELVAAA